MDILDEYARNNNAIPLYCFYNTVSDLGLAQRGWHCNYDFDALQLGCTVVPLHEVRPSLKNRAPKSFEALHVKTSALPWRCLVCCPGIVLPFVGSNGKHPLSPTGYEVTRHPALPAYLRRNDADDGAALGPGPQPRDILVIDLGDETGNDAPLFPMEDE